MSNMEEAVSAELQALSSKRASLKDKLKRRREAMGSILSMAEAAASAPSSSTKLGEDGKEASKTVEEKSFSAPNNKIPKTDTEEHREEKAPSENKTKNASSSRVISGKKRTSADNDDILSLLSMQSAKEKQDKEHREEILELLSKPTAKERTLMDSFKSQSGGGVKEFCAHSTKNECMKVSGKGKPCDKLHFAKIIQAHTDESLGDCSFLNTCFHMDSCKYIHYEVDMDDIRASRQQDLLQKQGPEAGAVVRSRHLLETRNLVSPQWVQCDLRNFDLSVLGKFSVIMADPPWDIHMELPYGTMSDDEMRQLPVPTLQEEGLIFLWVTGRAMELGRECLKLWGYQRVDELIWVKTNQLQRIIRTGRTGHWLNHGKEHCLVGMKGSNLKLNRGLDCDVIVAEVRATSHKPDEIYGIIERLSPGTRKIELFGRPHNVQPNWVTLGNQLDGIVVHDAEVLTRFNEVYPDGYELVKGMVLHPRKEP